MKYTVVSVVFTAFAVGGVANAINIIDGLCNRFYASAVCVCASCAANADSDQVTVVKLV